MYSLASVEYTSTMSEFKTYKKNNTKYCPCYALLELIVVALKSSCPVHQVKEASQSVSSKDIKLLGTRGRQGFEKKGESPGARSHISNHLERYRCQRSGRINQTYTESPWRGGGFSIPGTRYKNSPSFLGHRHTAQNEVPRGDAYPPSIALAIPIAVVHGQTGTFSRISTTASVHL